MSKNHVIVAPHVDDECIGNFEILNNPDNKVTIIYGVGANEERRKEAAKLREYFPSIKNQVFHMSVPSPYLSKDNTLYFPDHTTEFHPEHRGWGMLGEQLARAGHDVVFYTISMNVPYIHHLTEEHVGIKKMVLNEVYKSQVDLWKYEWKYILFEGRCKWIF